MSCPFLIVQMLFTHFTYALFFIPVFAANWLVPSKWRWSLLLLASTAYYSCWSVSFLPILFFVTGCSWLSACLLFKSQDPHCRKNILIAGILLTITPLFTFKYWNFLVDSFGVIFPVNANTQKLPLMNFAVPVGVSFFTFKAIGYLVDVYRGTVACERRFLRVLLFVSFSLP